ncbi:MAG: 3-hydroxyacyl-CoA dehydrogenase family protein [Ruminococcaceae bacterium]|nr:3-hydroxyacyl-CoA dehydrogenase family protein [Oscillospiraceae bacterium]
MVKNVSVIGAGNMGQQIAMNAAITGFHVHVHDSNPEMLKKMQTFKTEYLAGRVQKGRLTREQADAAAERLVIEADFEKAVSDADLVIEAVIELLEVKRDVFKKLDEVCPAHTILTTNSSYICSSEIAGATGRPDKVCNMHFFFPALVMKLVEIAKGPETSDETVAAVYEASEKMAKVPIVLNREIPGFIVNRLTEMYTHEAYKLADMGIASPEDIDKAAKYGLGYPKGPFELADLTGIDLAYKIYCDRYSKSGDPADLPGVLLSRHYHAGEYGVKTGKGFYDYSGKDE